MPGFFVGDVRRGRRGAEPLPPDVVEQSLRCPPSLLRQVLRVSYRKGRCAARVLIWPTAAPLVRNSPRGWAPKTLPDPEVRVGRAKARGGVVGGTAARRHGDTATRQHAAAGANGNATKVFGNQVPATARQPSLPHRWVFRQRP